ncbi:ead/Ea22-like family protein [Escherichia coli]|uniref:ead/Ea22-like family protein n=1 Tax=Escherichia coli TaxID=562 RepID=UPI00106B5EA7|nr:ead/Ea22-like family protein [Escherichia coli]
MSNIDKQALREIAAEAVGAHERLSVMPPDDIFDISLAEGTQLDADITALNALNSAANPTTVLALLDELEAKDKVWSAQDNHINQQADRIESLEKKNGDLGRALEAAEKRIAELEAKLDSADKLQDSAFRHGLQHGFSLGQTDNQAGFEECLSAYGTGKGE